jgi:hypothetical protein
MHYVFRNKFIFYGEGLLAPLPTRKLEDHPLSFVGCCVFNLFAAIIAEGRFTNRNLRTRLAVVRGTHWGDVDWIGLAQEQAESL